MWLDDINLVISWKSVQVICSDIIGEEGNPIWSLLACYGPPYYNDKKDFWNHITNVVSNLNRPWTLFGDLNKIINSSEKFGGHQIWKMELYLKQFIHEVVGIDLGFIGGWITCDNQQGRQTLIRERLDRAMVDKNWLEGNPQEENSKLIRIPSAKEVKDVVWSLHPLKSPGPYGFSGIFFRIY